MHPGEIRAVQWVRWAAAIALASAGFLAAGIGDTLTIIKSWTSGLAIGVLIWAAVYAVRQHRPIGGRALVPLTLVGVALILATWFPWYALEDFSFSLRLLRLDDAEVMLNTAYDRGERPAALDPRRIAAHEDTVIYFGCRDVDAAYSHVRAEGLDVRPPKVAWYGMKQLYLKDPDGYLICFQGPAA